MSNGENETNAAGAVAGALLGELLKLGVPALIDAIQEAVAASGKENAEELRKRPMTISVSFGGGEGEAVEAQRTIEAKLPASFDPNA